ncbi:HlyD family efflux transporter periplasmic adaptor subunit [Halomonas desiderata]|uniref:HlyD family secretion protein n=1 Tax=Billgrantia desiderata TaxID=52021 RepID=UPI00174DEEF7|nr:HlyD family efflux transporter periplasmic adaptor subunit [Halomonas desiderata]
MRRTNLKWIFGLAAVLIVALFYASQRWYGKELAEGFAQANGRVEAVEIDIATLKGGRVLNVHVREGDFINSGQTLAQMDTAVLNAQRREAEALRQRAVIGIETAESLVRQREAEKEAASALVAQRQAEAGAAQARLSRSQRLAAQNALSQQVLDDDRASHEGARAALAAARAQVAATEAALSNARALIVDARAAVEAAEATIERIQADIDDSLLLSPRDGRVQYRVAQPGEVLSPGGTVLNMIDLNDVYMTFFLPTEQAGRIAMGSEVRIVLDAAPQYVLPARVSFVADVAQFTPRTVETAEERQKLMFRVRANIDPILLEQYLHLVKTGLPGMAYIRLDPQAEWPADLRVRLPE